MTSTRIARTGSNTSYGLAASIWTRNFGIAHKPARRIKASGDRALHRNESVGGGAVTNAAATPVFRHSREGRESRAAGFCRLPLDPRFRGSDELEVQVVATPAEEPNKWQCHKPLLRPGTPMPMAN
jgi:hypothetical protein